MRDGVDGFLITAGTLSFTTEFPGLIGTGVLATGLSVKIGAALLAAAITLGPSAETADTVAGAFEGTVDATAFGAVACGSDAAAGAAATSAGATIGAGSSDARGAAPGSSGSAGAGGGATAAVSEPASAARSTAVGGIWSGSSRRRWRGVGSSGVMRGARQSNASSGVRNRSGIGSGSSARSAR
jgi:hypothetical protein